MSLSRLQTQYFKTWCFRTGSVTSTLFHQHFSIITGTCFIGLVFLELICAMQKLYKRFRCAIWISRSTEDLQMPTSQRNQENNFPMSSSKCLPQCLTGVLKKKAAWPGVFLLVTLSPKAPRSAPFIQIVGRSCVYGLTPRVWKEMSNFLKLTLVLWS